MTAVDRFPRLRSEPVRYTIPLGVIALATAASYFSGNIVHFPYLVSFVAAVAFSTLFGRGPGTLALILAILASDYFFIHPIFSISLSQITWLVAGHYTLAFLLMLVGVELPVRKGWDQKIKFVLFLLFKNFIPIRDSRNGQTQLLGRLDGHLNGEIYGWAVDPSQDSVAPKLTVYVDSRPVGEICAVHYRPDVESHSFYFDLTRCSDPNPRARVEARFANAQPLANSPLMVEIPVARPSHHPGAILFMHIAKTAGTAFREAMIKNYKQSEIAYLYPDPPGFLTGDLGLLPLEQRRSFRLVVGHFQYGIHQFLPQQCTYITIVRDPVSRVVSQYRYQFAKPSEKAIDKQDLSPAHLVGLLESHQSIALDNYMVRCFSGVSEKDFPPGHIGRQEFDLALRNLKTSFSFVGHQERSSDAYVALAQMFSWELCSLPDINRSAPVFNQDFAAVRSAIEHFNSWDCLLYSEIRRLF